jgi:hypothetical protein
MTATTYTYDDEPKKKMRNGFESMSLDDSYDESPELMSTVVNHILSTGGTLDLSSAYHAVAVDPQSVLRRQRAFLAQFVAPDARANEHAHLKSIIARLRAGQLLPSQVCPGAPDDCEYARAQILIECEDQFRALDILLTLG